MLCYQLTIDSTYNFYLLSIKYGMRKKIVFTGGGTLGHVMPNLYLAEDLTKNYDLTYIGSNGIESQAVRDKNITFYEIPTVKLVRGKILKNLKIPFVLIKSIFRAKKILKEIKPDIIFSKGGYVSLPVCIAGRILKIPIVAHESDYSFGLSNKIILKLCTKMCVNFSHLTKQNKKIIYTGPIFSKEFDEKVKANELNLDENKKTILFVGGSLGSKKINAIIYSILKDLLKDFNVIHITGNGNKKLNSFDNYNVFSSYESMVKLYNTCDIVVGRSGAGVTSESFFKKRPMILIPLENKATRGDQVLNAKYYEKLGVAEILRESDLTAVRLLEEIQKFSKNLNYYKENYKKINIVNGRETVINLIENYLK